jgi:cell division protein FtsI (penicillin-binding protein 3)
VSRFPSRQEERRALTLGARRRVLLGVWLVGVAVVLGRSTQLQVLEGADWQEAAAQQHRTSSEVPAARGAIVDRDGVELAITRERIKVSVAPTELTDRDAAVELLRGALELSAREARRLTDPARRWSVVPGRYAPTVRERLAGVQGVYLERELERFYPHGDLARGVLGAVIDGVGQGGIEQRYEDLLRGTPGREIAARDHAGKEIPGEVVRVEEPVPGGEVRLTLDLDLQEIAHAALEDALETTGARGGDLLVTDPRTGEVLALVSMGDGKSNALSAINAPYEPGSTLKPFTVAGLLANRLASLDDTVETAAGSWTVAGRTITDVHPHPNGTLAEALSVSSNVGIARAAQAFTPGEQYETLRDFGFGLPTGVELPGEVGGTLRRPDRWSGQSAVSLAIGYEIGVTPLQMALAYGALANGGSLMEPRLVAETKDGAGEVIERREPREVRRVIPGGVARDLAVVLEQVVEDGTATAARLETFRVAGKTGTARAHVDGRYSAGRYYSSFVGFFPADAPQLVVFVKLDSPKGAYYGGATAAPVTRAMMEGALAARQSPLDRNALLKSLRRADPDGERRESPAPARRAPTVRFANHSAEPRPLPALDPMDGANAPLPTGGVTVPDLTGLAPRAAVRRLHALGFRVRWQGTGTVTGSIPAAGTRMEPGDTVSLRGAVSLQ